MKRNRELSHDVLYMVVKSDQIDLLHILAGDKSNGDQSIHPRRRPLAWPKRLGFLIEGEVLFKYEAKAMWCLILHKARLDTFDIYV